MRQRLKSIFVNPKVRAQAVVVGENHEIWLFRECSPRGVVRGNGSAVPIEFRSIRSALKSFLAVEFLVSS